MGPIVLPESFQRRRSRGGVGDLPTFSAMSAEEKSHPPSPKMEAKNRMRVSKSQENLFPLTSLSDRAWASRSRDNLSNHVHDECQSTELNLADKQSLFRDLCQTQLSLWTFTASTLLTYFWQKRIHVRSVLFALCALSLTGFLSGVLATVVTVAHLFNSDFAASFGGFGDWLGDDDHKYAQLVRRQSSGHSSKSRRSSGSGGSGTTTPRGGVGCGGGEKMQQARFWQKNISLERTYIGGGGGGSSSRS